MRKITLTETWKRWFFYKKFLSLHVTLLDYLAVTSTWHRNEIKENQHTQGKYSEHNW